jgi:hypothetical protein
MGRKLGQDSLYLRIAKVKLAWLSRVLSVLRCVCSILKQVRHRIADIKAVKTKTESALQASFWNLPVGLVADTSSHHFQGIGHDNKSIVVQVLYEFF